VCGQPPRDGPELDVDPIDATKARPPARSPPRPVGRTTLDRNATNDLTDVEQAAFGTGALAETFTFFERKTAAGPHLRRRARLPGEPAARAGGA
jgi:catalase